MNKAGFNQYKRAKASLYRRPWFIALTWVCSFASFGLVYLSAKVLAADVAGFRSCHANDTGLQSVACGKASVNFGDLVLFILFAASSALMFSLFTAALRMVRKKA